MERDYDRIIDQYDQVEALPEDTPGRDRMLEQLEYLAGETAKGFENCTEGFPPVIDPNDYFVCIIGGGGGGCDIPIPDIDHPEVPDDLPVFEIPRQIFEFFGDLGELIAPYIPGFPGAA